MISGRGIGSKIFRGTSRALMATLLVSTAIGAGLAVTYREAAAQTQARTSFSVPAGPLNLALTAFGRQAGVQVTYLASAAAGKTSPGFSGSATREQALAGILAGSGLVYAFPNATTVAISTPAAGNGNVAADGSTQLETITVQAAGATTEGTGSYTTGQMTSATRLPLSIRETPQSVSVVTRQKMEDKSYQSLDQAISDTPGMVAIQSRGNTRYEYYSRGRQVDNIQYDGVSHDVNFLAPDVNTSDEMDMYDRVEVIRGAAGFTQGAGEPSGAINLIRKRPTEARRTSVTATGSSFGNGKTVLDTSGAINDTGTLRGRFVGSFTAGDTSVDYNSVKNGLLYGVIDADITENTTVSLGYSFQKQKLNGYDFTYLPSRRDGSFYDLDASTFLGNEWAYADRTAHTLYLEAEHRFDNDWKLKATGRANWSDGDFKTSAGYYSGNDYMRLDQKWNMANDVYSFDTNITGPVNLFDARHDVVFGINASRTDLDYKSAWGPSYVVDPENWDPTSRPEHDNYTPRQSLNYQTTQYGIYGGTRLNITDDLRVLLGGRISWFDSSSYENYLVSAGAGTYSGIRENAKFVPYAGISYDLTERLTAYASYTTIFKPQSGVFDSNNALLGPIEGSSTEVGLKGEFFDGALNASVSLFQTNRDNLATIVSEWPTCTNASWVCYEGVDGARTRGVELELSGNLTDRLRVTAGYTYAASELTEGPEKGQSFETYVYPEHLFRLFTSYTFADEKTTIGGGVRAQSKVYSTSGTYHAEQPAYAVVDLMAKYALTEKSVLQLNVNNVFDRDYYQAINLYPQSGFVKGAPREFRLTFRHEF